MSNAYEENLAATINSLRTEHFSAVFLRWLQTCLPHDNVSVLAYFQWGAPEPLLLSGEQPSVHARLHDVYLAGAFMLDPFYELFLKSAKRDVYRLDEIAPDQFHRNQYFLKYYRNTGLLDELAFVTYPSTGVSVHICLGQDTTSNKRFSRRDIAAARRVAPIVCAVADNHWSSLARTKEHSIDDTAQRLISDCDAMYGIRLSYRQAQVALLVLKGHSSVSIGLKLGISHQTVKVFRKQLYKKCTISSQAELFTLMLPLLTSN